VASRHRGIKASGGERQEEKKFTWIYRMDRIRIKRRGVSTDYAD